MKDFIIAILTVIALLMAIYINLQKQIMKGLRDLHEIDKEEIIRAWKAYGDLINDIIKKQKNP